MEFSKLNSPTLKDLFIKELETMILSGKLQIGEKLPSERELAKSM
ncbi:MAG: GntR family transcriptional regulator, partial [Clostridium sp.]|nr:GntR family transcriptional regulator [Clostridium sp.]